MPGFSLQLASFLLLLFTAGMTIKTHIFQNRTSIRESLEQLEDVEVKRTVKVKAILHKFDFWGLSLRKFLFGKTVLLVKFYNMEQVPEAAADPSRSMFDWLTHDEMEEFLDDLQSSISEISDIEAKEGEFEITIYSRNSVKIRRVADEVTSKIRENRVKA